MSDTNTAWRARMRASMDAFIAGLKDCSPAEAILIRLGYMAGYEQGRKDRPKPEAQRK